MNGRCVEVAAEAAGTREPFKIVSVLSVCCPYDSASLKLAELQYQKGTRRVATSISLISRNIHAKNTVLDTELSSE